eukprot:TRINITY_DN15317_c0_g1_i1.p1 TRINITY_DN15317_c0_g1~~TRINITY_DN15317_c0_g1_i1.p1  ORF type:complete len:516 (+),score=98.09 TRINITY_DN15317_c0_g1_i1:38-1585(+)
MLHNLCILLCVLVATVCTEEIIGEEEHEGNYTCHMKVAGEVVCLVEGAHVTYENKADEVISPSTPAFWMDLAIVFVITLVSGAMSGLTIGLMGMDLTHLEIMSKSGTPEEKGQAARVIPLVRKHHLTLVTLLLVNAAAMETLPIFLERLVPPVLAIIFSVTLILLFGEIIPQSLCARYGLAIGADSAWFVWILIGLSFPISYPISKLLDWLIGEDHQTYFKRAELKELIAMHEQRTVSESNKDIATTEEGLTYDEISIIKGALDMTDKKAGDVLTPLTKCFMLNVNELLNQNTLKIIKEEGHSRVPVYKDSREHIVGMLLVKNLIIINPSENTLVGSIHLQPLPHVPASTPLYNTMSILRAGRSHMALVIDETDCLTPLGVITLENVIEELIQEDIADETDRKRYANMKKKGIEGAVDELGTTSGWKKKEKKGTLWDSDSSSSDDENIDLESELSGEVSSDDLDSHFRKIIEVAQAKRQQRLQQPEIRSSSSSSLRSSLSSAASSTSTRTTDLLS